MEFIDRHTPIGQLVVDRPDRARLFERLELDYCYAGTQSLDEACRSAGIDTEDALVQLAVDDLTPTDIGVFDPARLTLSGLTDHIEATHHAYLREQLPRLDHMFEQVVKVHGGDYPWLHKLQWIFSILAAELEMHIMKEEQILFPMVCQLETAVSLPDFYCGGIGNPIAAMRNDHDTAGRDLASLRQLSGGFTAPDDASNIFRALLAGLAELEADLHQHIHKENNILFARASEAEGWLRVG